ncbi:MAG: hypothetical protein RLZZ127_3069 [Planctomycetota bacterium]|jgi:hypothetical protein
MDAERIVMIHDRERRLRARWWAVSIALHLAGVAALIWWTGLREWVFSPSRPADPLISVSDLHGARATLLDLYRTKMRDAAGELGGIADEIAGFTATRVAQVMRQDPHLADAAVPAIDPAPAVAGTGSLPGLYAAVCAQEHRVEASYELLRTVDLVSLQRLPLSRALVVAKMPRTARRPMRAEIIERRITRLAELDELKAELVEAHLEAQAAIAAAGRLRTLARQVMGLENASGLVLADLSGTDAAAQGVPWTDDKAYVGALLFPTDLVRDGAVNALDARPVLGTTIGDRHRAADWLALDTWWIVGPFEHPGNARPEDLDRIYPPEARPGADVDLDEVYAGKGGRVLRWLWHQSNDVMVNPLAVPGMPASPRETYAIWYAWTEVWCDRPRKAWMAVGSDDFSAVWLNGVVVFQSGRSPQAWFPFKPDGFRQIDLHAGLNRFLVKLENKGGTTGFSVCINLDEAL